MKLAQLFIFMFVAYLAMGVLNNFLNVDITSSGISLGNVIFDVLLQPGNWSSQTFWVIFGTIGIIGAGIVAGSMIFSKSDISTLAPLAGVFIVAGGYIMSSMYSFVRNGFTSFVCKIGEIYCFESNLAAGLIVGIIGIMYFFSVIEWWFWRPTSSI